MKILYILSPNDRFNYGDLIFAHVIKNKLLSSIDKCVFVSTSESDLSDLGSFPTVSFRELYNACDTDTNILIVAGGESLCVKWSVILSYIVPLYNFIYNFFKKIHVIKYITNLLSFLFKKFCGAKTRYPFTIGKKELPNFSLILYNSLGGCSLYESSQRFDSELKKLLNSVTYLSVRDKYTKLALENNGINAYLCPDSAILMNAVFDEETLLSHLIVDLNDYNNTNYIFVQTSDLKEDKLKILASHLEQIYKSYRRTIVLCPIGTAMGHCNQYFLKKMSSYMDKKSFLLVESVNLWTIMWLIKHSSLYVGTSLHGAITAMSFKVPFVTYGQHKVKSYINTWTPEYSDILYGSFNSIYNRMLRQIQNPIIIDNTNQIFLSNESFDKMNDLIKNA